MTLDDHLKRAIRTLLQKRYFSGSHHKNLNEDKSRLSAAKCSPMTLVSRNIRYVDNRGIARGVASNDSGVVDDGNFRRLRWLLNSSETLHYCMITSTAHDLCWSGCYGSASNIGLLMSVDKVDLLRPKPLQHHAVNTVGSLESSKKNIM